MINLIRDILNKNNIKIYNIKEEKESSLEMFFVKKEMTLKRMKETIIYNVTVYNEFYEGNEHFLGSANTLISPDMNEDEIELNILDAFNSSKFVKNKFYKMPENVVEKVIDYTILDNMALIDIAQATIDAIYKNDINEDYFINSAEIFVTRKNIHIVTNNNDVEFVETSISGETVCQCISPTDVELFNIFEYNDFDMASLEKEVMEQLEMTKIRSQAIKEINSCDMNVMLSGKCVRDLFDFYLDRASFPFVYKNYSSFEIGKDIQEASGDKLNINLIKTRPFTDECVKKEDITLIENGICKSLIGSSRFAYYLDKMPTGYFDKIKVNTGSLSNDDLKEPYLEAIYFSNLQVDSFSGFFGGEIRLAIFHKDGKDIPITGCSISGNLLDAQKNLKLSLSTQSFGNYDGPDKIFFKNISVSGN